MWFWSSVTYLWSSHETPKVRGSDLRSVGSGLRSPGRSPKTYTWYVVTGPGSLGINLDSQDTGSWSVDMNSWFVDTGPGSVGSDLGRQSYGLG